MCECVVPNTFCTFPHRLFHYCLRQPFYPQGSYFTWGSQPTSVLTRCPALSSANPDINYRLKTSNSSIETSKTFLLRWGQFHIETRFFGLRTLWLVCSGILHFCLQNYDTKVIKGPKLAISSYSTLKLSKVIDIGHIMGSNHQDGGLEKLHSCYHRGAIYNVSNRLWDPKGDEKVSNFRSRESKRSIFRLTAREINKGLIIS